MLISSNDKQEMQVSQTEGFGERNVEWSGQQFDDLEHPFAQNMKSVYAMNLESSKRKCPRSSHNACCSCLDICLQASRYTFMCNTFLAVLDTGPSLLGWSKIVQSLCLLQVDCCPELFAADNILPPCFKQFHVSSWTADKQRRLNLSLLAQYVVSSWNYLGAKIYALCKRLHKSWSSPCWYLVQAADKETEISLATNGALHSLLCTKLRSDFRADQTANFKTSESVQRSAGFKSSFVPDGVHVKLVLGTASPHLLHVTQSSFDSGLLSVLTYSDTSVNLSALTNVWKIVPGGAGCKEFSVHTIWVCVQGIVF
jgi:hypothetical protein